MKRLLLLITIFFVTTNTFANTDNTSLSTNKHKYEFTAGIGMTGMEVESLSSGNVLYNHQIIPYANVEAKVCFGNFCPEIRLQNSFSFYGDIATLNLSYDTLSFSKYYIKLPTMIPLNFFSYPAMILFDFEYDSITNTMQLTSGARFAGGLQSSGTKFAANYTTFTARLYVDTPVVEVPSLFEHAYFGVYYSYISKPASVAAGITPYSNILIANTYINAGGIFYDIKKDMIVKGLNLGVLAQVGYGDLNVYDDFGIDNVKFGNLYGLVAYKINVEIGYRYIFNNGIGVNANVGVNYNGSIDLLGTADPTLYTVNTAGYFKYYATLNFVFRK